MATRTGWATPGLPRADLSPRQQRLRMLAIRLFLWIATRAILRVRLVGREHIPAGPAMYCFNHLGWIDPIVLMAAFPLRSRLYFYGPKETDMRVGGRNRLMWWSGISVPFKPGKDDLITSVRRSQAIFDSGARTVFFERVPYDVEKTREKIHRAGLPGMLGDRLLVGA